MTLTGSAHVLAIARLCARVIGIAMTSAKSGRQSARGTPVHSVHRPAFLGRKLTIHTQLRWHGFPNVKLLSRFVTLRITLKAIADVVGKAVTLIITIVAARRLNADPFGVMAYAMATGWLLGVATDAGLSMHLARETARLRGDAASAGQARRLLVEVISLRTGLAFVAATAGVVMAPQMVPAHWRVQFIVIVLAQVAGAVNETIAHYFRGIQRSEIESAIHAAHRLVTLVWALIVLWIWRRLDYLAIAMLVPPLVAAVVSAMIAARLSRSSTPPQEAGASTGAPLLTPAKFMRDVFPLGAGVLISALYFRIDVYFIQQWHGFQPVGGYNAAFRLVEALRLLPAAVLAVTFPMLVTASDTQLVRRIGAALTAAGAVLALICALGGSIIIPLIYGDAFAYAAPAFSILALALPLFFLNYALTHQVIGWDGQLAYLLIATLALIANVVANLLLIPTQGINGAAIATVLTEIVVTAGCLVFLNLRVEPSRGTNVLNHRVELS
jgi:O-antigen/teichoic acid export membrane protein